MKLGMVGLPNVGKSALFNALSGGGADSANYPFCTIEPNVGIVSVPDERLDELAKIYQPEKFTPATLEFVDIAGLIRGASKGEGLGNQFLAHIRESDAMIHLVRCFEDENVVHVEGSVNPLRDVQTIELELIFSDLEILSRRMERLRKQSKGNPSLLEELAVLERLKAHLEDGRSARNFAQNEKELQALCHMQLLSAKPVIYAANLSEDDYLNGIKENEYISQIKEYTQREGGLVLPVCAKIEEELASLEEEDRLLFLRELGLSESSLSRVIKTSYKLLGLISFLTAGKPEVRAWTVKKGTKAPQAAGKIHSDFERGFIRAEVINYLDFIRCGGSMAAAREKGLLRLEGKDYIMQDGDIVLFRFNVS